MKPNDQINDSTTNPANDRTLMVLLEEYRMLSAEVMMYMTELLKVPVLAVAAIAFIFGIRGSEGFSDFSRLVGVPVLAGLIFYVAFLYYAVIRTGRYRALLEREINDLLEETYLRWNSELTKRLEWYNDKRGVRRLTFILHPMYLSALFGVSVIFAVAVLLMAGKLTPAQIWGKSAIYWMSGLLVVALLSLIYVVTFGRTVLEKRIGELYRPRGKRTAERKPSS